VRLEDAPRLGRWLFGGEMPQGSATEERFDLPQLVPVYITYLTVAPENGTLAMIGDPYGRDRSAQPALAIEAVGKVASR
jgi:murein L,D-transpeptidase YcbB/YkuD